MNFILQWLDLLWLPLGLIFTAKGQRIWTLIFMSICSISLRVQVELMAGIGYPEGILQIIDMPVLYRGIICYSLIYGIYLALIHYFYDTKGIFLMSLCLSGYILGLCFSMVVMLL